MYLPSPAPNTDHWQMDNTKTVTKICWVFIISSFNYCFARVYCTSFFTNSDRQCVVFFALQKRFKYANRLIVWLPLSSNRATVCRLCHKENLLVSFQTTRCVCVLIYFIFFLFVLSRYIDYVEIWFFFSKCFFLKNFIDWFWRCYCCCCCCMFKTKQNSINDLWNFFFRLSTILFRISFYRVFHFWYRQSNCALNSKKLPLEFVDDILSLAVWYILRIPCSVRSALLFVHALSVCSTVFLRKLYKSKLAAVAVAAITAVCCLLKC